MTRLLILAASLLVVQAGCSDRPQKAAAVAGGWTRAEFNPENYFPMTPGATWKYKVVVARNVVPLGYNLITCPTDDGNRLSEERRLIHPPNEERQKSSGDLKYALHLRIDGPALTHPNGGDISNGVEIIVERDDLGIFDHVENMIWQAHRAEDDEITVLQTGVQEANHRFSENATGTAFSSQVVFFSPAAPSEAIITAPPVTYGCTCTLATNAKSKAIEYIKIFRMVAARSDDRGDDAHQSEQYRSQAAHISKQFNETAWYAKGKGLVRLEQRIDDQLSMTWTLEDFRPGDASAFSTEPDVAGRLRLDGLYRGDPSRFDGKTAYSYLRFDAAGSVYGMLTLDSPQEVAGHLQSRSHRIGRYTAQGSTLKFATSSSFEQLIRYEGVIKQDALVLNSVSANGHKGVDRYEFVAVDMAKAGTLPAVSVVGPPATRNDVIDSIPTFYDLRPALARLMSYLRERRLPAVKSIWRIAPANTTSGRRASGDFSGVIGGWVVEYEDVAGKLQAARIEALGVVNLKETPRSSYPRGIRPEEIVVDFRDALALVLSHGGGARRGGGMGWLMTAEIDGRGVRPVWGGGGWFIPNVAARVAVDAVTGELYPNDAADSSSTPTAEWKGTTAAQATAMYLYNADAERFEVDRSRLHQALVELAKRPPSLDISYQRGVVFAALGMWTDAVEHLTLSLTGNDPGDARNSKYHFARGMAYLAMRDLEAAERDFRALPQDGEQTSEALQAVAVVRGQTPLSRQSLVTKLSTDVGVVTLEIWLGPVVFYRRPPEPANSREKLANSHIAVSGIAQVREVSLLPLSEGAPPGSVRELRYEIAIRLTNKGDELVRFDEIQLTAAVGGKEPAVARPSQMLMSNGLKVDEIVSAIASAGKQFTITPGQQQVVNQSVEIKESDRAFDGPQRFRIDLLTAGRPTESYRADLPLVGEVLKTPGQTKELELRQY